MSQVLVEEVLIPTTRKKFFLEYVTLKKPIIDAILSKINKKQIRLTDILIKIYAHLLYYNDINKHLPDKDKWDLVFGTTSKKLICYYLGLKEHHLNNYFSILRKMKILNGKSINKPFIVYSSQVQTLSFKFKINGQDREIQHSDEKQMD